MGVKDLYIFLFFSFEKVHASCFDVKSIYFLIRYFWEGLGVVGFQGGFWFAKDSNYIVQQVLVNSLAFQTFNPSL